jgi:cyclopropane fatty-acyl-phospholipid synthase-like methyltransferase
MRLGQNPGFCWKLQRDRILRVQLPPFQPAMCLTPELLYGHDPIAATAGLEGAGILAYITGDQLHPPMVDDEKMWRSGSWNSGAVRHVEEAGQLCELRARQRILDIGCGIGGASRVLAKKFGVHVVGTNIAAPQIKTARRLDEEQGVSDSINYILHDCQTPFPPNIGYFDVAWSMNMFYHVENASDVIQHATKVLSEDGRIMIDDWMLTSRATKADRESLQHHFISPHFLVQEQLTDLLAKQRLRVLRWVDLGHIGRTHLAAHFRSAFDSHFRTSIELAYGTLAADSFVASVEHTIALYRQDRLTYVRVVAKQF